MSLSVVRDREEAIWLDKSPCHCASSRAVPTESGSHSHFRRAFAYAITPFREKAPFLISLTCNMVRGVVRTHRHTELTRRPPAALASFDDIVAVPFSVIGD